MDCLTNYHRLGSLKEHTFISPFLWVRSLGLAGSSAQDLTRLRKTCQLKLSSHSTLDWERICFQDPSGWWQNSFSSGVRSMANCSFKTSIGERAYGKMGAILLGNHVNAVMYIPSPLLHSTGYKQVTGPAHAQGRGVAQRCDY